MSDKNQYALNKASLLNADGSDAFFRFHVAP